MKIKYELTEIDGYPDIVPQVEYISDIVKIRINGTRSYYFTVSLKNSTCINVSRVYTDDNQDETFQAISQLRRELAKEVVHSIAQESIKARNSLKSL